LVSPEIVHRIDPGDSAVPKDRNQSAPWPMIAWTVERVSTFLTRVGLEPAARPVSRLLPVDHPSWGLVLNSP
jgi:hypothetical protein